ncbi:alpha/beta fold hydrolase [Peribacillus cavernae]|uniref:Alpha/beta fold hydrolase n=1 Tax=Peribacillus cavernae TaxID=1674310 RepID=A0A433HQN1_9BACI|nr:alpha/beta fold hydrolase [Peribacillus cavernae]MDQ0216993.1 polyhydroxyalkanoate synthase [Peribacillus cavernae]RUQ30522.1 alpha/beta fold hydrolase [Peribacillus cavernae]
MANLEKDDRFKKDSSKWEHFLNIWKQPLPEIGMTAREAVWKKNKSVLWYYPPVEKKYNVPIFLIYSLVNKPTILDLAPGESIIEALVNEGFQVYLLDFGIPGYEDSGTSIDDYLTDYIEKGVQRALRHSKALEITVMGFCLGGTLAAMYTAIADEPVKNLILSVTPIDFSGMPTFDQWAAEIKKGNVNFDELIDVYGTVPADFIQAGIRLTTSPLYFSHYLSLLNKADDKAYVERWRRFNTWSNGHIPFAGAALKQLMEDLGRKNKLVNGGLNIKGRSGDLQNITANLLVTCSMHDRLVPEEMIRPVMDLVSSRDKKYQLLDAGHATMTETGGLPPYLKKWLPKRSDPVK